MNQDKQTTLVKEKSSLQKHEVIDGQSVVKKDIDAFKHAKPSEQIQIDVDDKRFARLGWISLIIVFVIFGGWSAIAKIDNAAVAAGEVVVESSNKSVQHLEGGLVAEILVKEGDLVVKGQTLLKLSPTQAQAELSMIQSQLDESYGAESRLRAEQMGLDKIQWVDEMQARSNLPSILQIQNSQEAVFKARKEAKAGELSIYSERINALKQQISGLSEYLNSLQNRIDSYKAELIDWEALYKEQFTDKIRLQEMKRQLAQLQGEYDQNVSEIARLKVQITENTYQKILATQNFSKEVADELSKTLAQKVDLSYRKQVLQDKLNRVDIVSPADGKVQGLQIVTVGSVVRPGETIMEVVPQNEGYAAKVRVSPIDIDKVKVGLITHVRFSAFNTQITHVVEGQVINVSPDKFVDPKSGMEYFEAKVLITPKGIKQMEKDGMYMRSGMPVEAMIKVGDRTLLGYLMKPFTDMIARSFNED
ncbi:HlyD family type I secretion periplasmic adaptor subunit [Thiosulfativibrio zosterae]|uniref:Membrane fusion protein (MFP) family protein n=1 Tax=Thiosulfativibrio zosterae TaxID=2675053 RepID=A0A6F8PQA1_9GAMM|nr:HlyD family type I secretion periplasmic adaptor subunit [Thiosulfativibrio zosterae]BBP44285.1 HlyD family type I secretion periplasmic adaptor subunit [Thiosulfativibrio zosterae]